MGDNRISKVAVIHYSYDPTSGSGSTRAGLDILVDDYENDVESAKILERIDHECFLHCINDGIKSEEQSSTWKNSKKGYTSVEARERKNSDSGAIVYRLPRMGYSLDETFKKIKTPFIKKYRLLGTNLECTYVPDVWRDVMRRMVRFTLYLHQQGQSFANRLESRNFIFVGDHLKFCNLRLQPLSSQSIRNDFICIKEIIENLFKTMASTTSQTLEKPHDLTDLLKIMKSYSSSHSNSLEHHLAILSSRDRIRQIENLKSKQAQIQKLEGKTKLRSAMANIINSRDWISRFRGKCQNFGPAYDCLMHGSDGVNIDYGNFGEDLVRFCRNMAVHLPDFFVKHGVSFRDIDIDLTIMKFFSEELLSFQWEANKKMMLAYII